MHDDMNSWNLYFSSEEYLHISNIKMIVSKIKRWINSNFEKAYLESAFKRGVVEVKIEDLLDFLDLTESENLIKLLSYSFSEVLVENGFECIYIRLRIVGFKSESCFDEINTNSIGKLVCITGIVCRIGPRRILFRKLYFECRKCKEVIILKIENNVYRQPKKCNGNCRSRSFKSLTDNPDSGCIDFQDIKIQEMFNQSKMPKIVEAVLYDDFVGSIAPGEVVQIIGILKAEAESKDLYKLKIHINNIILSKAQNCFQIDHNIDFCRINEMSKTHGLLNSLIHSIFPTIFGNEIIKIGMVLAMFGGTEKFAGVSKVRSEIHILMIGDPGLGKSKMLLLACNILPKSNYVSGNFTTTAGLTVSLTHDPISGDFIAEAGVLVLSDGGICCLDEFDKIQNHKSLYEVMDQQKISVAKGGVVCSVPSKTTVIAATNPKFGHFKKNKTLEENISFDSVLLTRFDLVFVLNDNLEENHSMNISNYILNSKEGKVFSSENSSADFILNHIRKDSFTNEFELKKDTVVFSIESIREYISYARSNVFPRLSSQAKTKIKLFYLDAKERYKLNIRHMESLIRLAESKAKIELRSIASQEDAAFAIELFKRSFFRSSEPKKYHKKKGFKGFIDILKKESENLNQDLFTTAEIVKYMDIAGIDKPKYEFLDALNSKGILIKKERDKYKLV